MDQLRYRSPQNGALLQDIIRQNRVWYCMDCGKCGAVCPVSRWETRGYTSPRLLIEKSIQGRIDEMMDEPLFWSCTTCKRCSQLCPSDVSFAEFVRDARHLARTSFERYGECTHSEMIQTWGRMMTNPDMRQNRLGWLSNVTVQNTPENTDLRFSSDSDTLYFVGCLPYYDPLFRKLGVEGVEIARAAVKIMNYLGIKPQILADERCCGHDQLWEGDVETFRALAALNIKMFKASGAKRIVTTCAECARTLKIDYPQVVGDHGLEVLHLAELLAEAAPFTASDLPLAPPADGGAVRLTYQDPCRLGRHMGVYDAPRKVMTSLGFELTEMERSHNASLCCGVSGWRACGQVSKSVQVERLEEAKATGAEMLVTTCLKCQIHFKCAQNDPILGERVAIPIRDLTTLVAERLAAQFEPLRSRKP